VVEQQVAAERVAALYGKGLLPYLTNIINGSVLAYVLRDVVSGRQNIGWLATLMGVTLLRMGLWRLYHRRQALGSPRRWGILFGLGVAVSGLVWGSTALLLFVPQATLHHALLAFVVGGMVAGATVTMSVYLPLFGLYTTLALLPLVIRLVATGQPLEQAMGATLALFGLAMTELARRTASWFTEVTVLRIRNDQLVKNLSARNELLAVASHELRTPLSAMSLNVHTLDQQLSANRVSDVDGLRARVQRLDRQVGRLTGLVDSLLTFSGAGKSGAHQRLHQVDLAVIVRSVVDDLVASTPSAADLLSLEIEGRLVGSWDAQRIEQIVTNLVSNALKYGGGSTVTVRLIEQDNDVVLTVQDQGPGIALPDQPRIFEKFFRTEEQPDRSGMGLGLSVVWDLVHIMGGDVTVASQPGHGATFTVRLPRQPPSPPRPPVEVHPP
jgi:signal transduction histidine kinase